MDLNVAPDCDNQGTRREWFPRGHLSVVKGFELLTPHTDQQARFKEVIHAGSLATFLKNVSLRHYTHNAVITRTIHQCLGSAVPEK